MVDAELVVGHGQLSYSTRRMRFPAAVLLVALAAACAAPPPVTTPTPTPQPPASTTPEGELALGTVRVTATTLNVRAEPSTSAASIAQVRKDDRLTLLGAGQEWMKVRLGSGEIGYVSKAHVVRDDGPASSGSTPSRSSRARRNGKCPADSEFSFAKPPTPSFSDSGAHGIVTIDVYVNAEGNVTSTKVLGNTTGDESLAFLAEREIKAAKFNAPVRGCVPKAFVYTYKRSF